MKRTIIFLLALNLVLLSCSTVNPAASTSGVSDATAAIQFPAETFVPSSQAITSDTPVAASVTSTMTATSVPTEEMVLPSGMPVISAPEEWYSTEMDVDNLHAVIFSHQNPEDEASSVDDFAIAALVTAPLPDGSDPAALQAGLAENLSSYNGDDLEGMLSAAQSLELIDLVSAEEIVLDEARLDTLGGIPALLMDGRMAYEGQDLRVQTWLCWTREIFLAYYQFAENENWQTYAASFDFARNSIQFP